MLDFFAVWEKNMKFANLFSWKIVPLMALVLVSQSWAIFGIGGHWSPSTGSLDGKDGPLLVVADTAGVTGQDSLTLLSFEQGSASGMQGFGLKFWIDIIPLIDVEATFNMHFARYPAAFIVHDPSTGDELASYPIELKFDGLPLGKAKPVFSDMAADLSINYPFLDLPLITAYAGGGVSYLITTPVMNDKFAKTFAEASGMVDDPQGFVEDLQDPTAAMELVQNLGEALAKEGLNHGMGGHVMAGARVKPPIIPLAVYANVKYYFGGDVHEQFTQGAVFELGGGLAF